MKFYSNNRIILIENEKGGWYEKAIFLLNKDVHKEYQPMEIVQEAERIIENYIRNSNFYPSKSKRKAKRKISYKAYNKRTNRVINVCLLLSIVVFIYYLFQLISSY
ncbi:MAG TPA: hypothetical protein PKK61_07800 [Defluviitaleaceae bacterium]|nr:hypothetical protein [Candidatus Epulonipiscium sp.]HOA80950.1 hypothetical protein [Defluviitaleaceae bacterium]